MSRRSLAAACFLLGVVIAAPNGFLIGWLAKADQPRISVRMKQDELLAHFDGEPLIEAEPSPGIKCAKWGNSSERWGVERCYDPAEPEPPPIQEKAGGGAFGPMSVR